MSAISIEKIKDYLSRPVIEWSHTEEAVACLIMAGIVGVIWLIGEIIYRWESRR